MMYFSFFVVFLHSNRQTLKKRNNEKANGITYGIDEHHGASCPIKGLHD